MTPPSTPARACCVCSSLTGIEAYRGLWIIILELWCANEETQQLNPDTSYRHDIARELGLFQQLAALFVDKLDKQAKLEDKKRAALVFEQTLAQATQGTDLLTKIQSKLREDVDPSPTHATSELRRSDSSFPVPDHSK